MTKEKGTYAKESNEEMRLEAVRLFCEEGKIQAEIAALLGLVYKERVEVWVEAYFHLRLPCQVNGNLSGGSFSYRWVQRTPAIASKLADHQWTPAELFNFKIPPPRWKIPKQRGKPSTAMLRWAQQWAS